MIKQKTKRMAKDVEKKYEYVDVEALANALAEADYKKETVGLPDRDLWEVEMVQKQGQIYVENGIHSRWATLFFDLKTNYEKLILSFKRKEVK